MEESKRKNQEEKSRNNQEGRVKKNLDLRMRKERPGSIQPVSLKMHF